MALACKFLVYSLFSVNLAAILPILSNKNYKIFDFFFTFYKNLNKKFNNLYAIKNKVY